ncbi:MAG: hypothetical protein AB1757_10745 [Acidobacteriota bacterium]
MNLLKPLLAIYLFICLVSCAANPNQSGEFDSDSANPATVTASRQPTQSTSPVSTTAPQLPATILDTTLPTTAGRKIKVAAGADGARNFQTALDQAKPGDVILLEAGATYLGNFTLPKKSGNEWIIIRSTASDAQLPAQGTRITPKYVNFLPKLITTNADPVIKTAAGAHHYRFIGIEFSVTATTPVTYDLLQLGSGAQTSMAEVAHDLIIDRCYLHGSATANLRRGIALNSAHTSVIDSHISDCHEKGADSQAICGWNGPGPFKIVNNYLEGAGENVMFGGADPKIANLVPSDIEFRRNHCFKPLAWKKNEAIYAGEPWSIKNIFELKNARRVLIEGNLFENNWVDAQSGVAILFTVRNQDGTAPWSIVEDVTFSNNILRHVAAAINILGRDNNNESQQVQRIKIYNNLIYDVGGKQWGGNGVFLQISDTRQVSVDHNTVVHRGNIITGHGRANEGFVFTNNFLPHNEYGVIGDGVGPGNPTIAKYFSKPTFKRNVLAGGRASLYPADNFFPANLDDLEKAEKNFNLPTTSQFKNAGTDGKDIGCDLNQLAKDIGMIEPKL